MVQIVPVVLITLFLLAFVSTCVYLYVRIHRKANAQRARVQQAQNYYTLYRFDPERGQPVVRQDMNADPALPSYIPRADKTQELPRLYDMIEKLESQPDTADNRRLIQDLRNEVERLKGPESSMGWADPARLPAVPPPTYSLGQGANQPHSGCAS
ncbi:hypothetical protein CVT24_002776 [Panaeolus cyanescens]|uniref:Uncharacterized protein n=1 Tax=Panaeolus cyanescens TaxID=181874 RepID=A0A409VNH1_9AGAR|nr:hypothetical protein CVT24_002776 [Panaeolus cyanescens]